MIERRRETRHNRIEIIVTDSTGSATCCVSTAKDANYYDRVDDDYPSTMALPDLCSRLHPDRSRKIAARGNVRQVERNRILVSSWHIDWPVRLPNLFSTPILSTLNPYRIAAIHRGSSPPLRGSIVSLCGIPCLIITAKSVSVSHISSRPLPRH